MNLQALIVHIWNSIELTLTLLEREKSWHSSVMEHVSKNKFTYPNN